MNDEQLLTRIMEIEHILNCRPSAPSSSDPDNSSEISPPTLFTACVDPTTAPMFFAIRMAFAPTGEQANSRQINIGNGGKHSTFPCYRGATNG